MKSATRGRTENALQISAEFVTSAAGAGDFPRERLPEVAFVGRSNVGKSSLINVLAGRKGLVRTSSTPGRTQLINFFDINGALTFPTSATGWLSFVRALRRARFTHVLDFDNTDKTALVTRLTGAPIRARWFPRNSPSKRY